MLRYAKDPRVRSFAIGIATLVYAVKLSKFTLSIDGELYAYEPRPWTWSIGQGRWALALLQYAAPPFENAPFVATAIFCAALAFSALLLSSCYARSRAEAFAFVGFFVSCPIWLHIGEANTIAWPVGVGLCLAAAAIALIQFRGYRGSIPAGIGLCFALGIYQALLPLAACGSLLSVGLNLRDPHRERSPSLRSVVGQLMPFVVSSLMAVLLYSAVTRMSLILFHQSLTYVSGFVRLGDFTAAETLKGAIQRTMRQLGGWLLGFDPTFIRWRWGILSLLPAWLGGIAAIARALRPGREQPRAILPSAALVLGFAVCAALPIIAAAGAAPSRTLLALPLAYGVGAASVMKNDWYEQKAKWLILSLSLVVNVWISASLFHADAIARDRDSIMATQLAERLAALPGFQRDHPRAFVLYGKWSHNSLGPALRVEWFGTSFFEQDEGNPWRVASFLRLSGIDGLQPAYISCAREEIADLDSLPSWPAPGSVALVRNKVVIKLGPLSDPQRNALAHVPCNL